MQAPRQLSISKLSPYYDLEACKQVDRVLVDGIIIPQCIAYDMDAGWARGKDEKGNWLPKAHGEVKVVMKEGN